MSNPAKTMSRIDGRRFLQQAFRKQQAILQAELDFASAAITHPTKQGDATEQCFLRILRAYLPRRYAVDSAIVIDSEGHTSDQIDVVVYDHQYTPVLLDQHAHKYVTAEAVYAVFEVKPLVNKATLVAAASKAATVRQLKRSPGSFGTTEGRRTTAPFFIPAGLVAARAGWVDGLGATFLEDLASLTGEQSLQSVLAVSSTSFDTFNEDGSHIWSPPGNALVFFLFRLLRKLQVLGTAPAADWTVYADVLAADGEVDNAVG
ncbi:MAG: hypothetical protein H7A47_03935 [Verrucomicrobiales bacterium]|nr:hypothetical protein [Verrucomicrobiales bacterium]